jgi:hypothetical protein
MIRYTIIIKTKTETIHQWMWSYTAWAATKHAWNLARAENGVVVSIQED